MKLCPYCHKEVRQTDTLCPHCGLHIPKMDETELDATQESNLQGNLFDQSLDATPLNSTTETVEPVEENLAAESSNATTSVEQTVAIESEPLEHGERHGEKRVDQELRMKGKEVPYLNWLKRGAAFFEFYREKLIHPTNTFKRRRTIHGAYGYISYGIAAVLAAFVLTRLIEAVHTKYDLLSQISVLPSVTATPNYLIIYFKSLIFFLCFYFGFPIISFFIKKIFLKRQHVFHYWMTQYAGMNAAGFLILLVTMLLSIIAPFALLVVIIFGLLMHTISFIITFIAALYHSMNETKIDTIYLSLIGLSLQFFILLSLLSMFI